MTDTTTDNLRKLRGAWGSLQESSRLYWRRKAVELHASGPFLAAAIALAEDNQIEQETP